MTSHIFRTLCRRATLPAMIGAFFTFAGSIGPDIMTIAPAHAAGDLLVAPTRVVLDGRRSSEVILNNIGTEPATYRISLELRRMQPNGALEDVTADAASASEKTALELIRYAPRRVELAPNQPQSIRIGLGPLDALPDGEYRAHMLFRAIPAANAPTAAAVAADGLRIELRPIYGVTIPIIVRKGQLAVATALSNLRVEATSDGATLAFDMARTGQRSAYGELRIMAPGRPEPLIVMKGIGIYPEVALRQFAVRLTPEQAGTVRGPITLQFWETGDSGATLAAETQATL